MTAKKCAKKRDARAKLFFLLIKTYSRCLSSIVYRGCRMPILVPMGILGCGMRDAGCGITGLKENLGRNDGIEEL